MNHIKELRQSPLWQSRTPTSISFFHYSESQPSKQFQCSRAAIQGYFDFQNCLRYNQMAPTEPLVVLTPLARDFARDFLCPRDWLYRWGEQNVSSSLYWRLITVESDRSYVFADKWLVGQASRYRTPAFAKADVSVYQTIDWKTWSMVYRNTLVFICVFVWRFILF